MEFLFQGIDNERDSGTVDEVDESDEEDEAGDDPAEVFDTSFLHVLLFRFGRELDDFRTVRCHDTS